jgi:hypothetical protein
LDLALLPHSLSESMFFVVDLLSHPFLFQENSITGTQFANEKIPKINKGRQKKGMEWEESKNVKKRRGLHKTKKRRKQARQEGKEWNGNEGKSVVGILSISQHFVFDPVRRGCKGFVL